ELELAPPDCSHAWARDVRVSADQLRVLARKPIGMPGVVTPVRDLVAPPEHALDVDLTGDGLGGPRRDASRCQHLRRPQQGLRWQARVVGALTSCELALDDRDLRVGIELSQGADEVLATRAGPEHEHPSVCHQAERAGFEPATHLSARTRFPVALLR